MGFFPFCPLIRWGLGCEKASSPLSVPSVHRTVPRRPAHRSCSVKHSLETPLLVSLRFASHALSLYTLYVSALLERRSISPTNVCIVLHKVRVLVMALESKQIHDNVPADSGSHTCCASRGLWVPRGPCFSRLPGKPSLGLVVRLCSHLKAQLAKAHSQAFPG